MDTAPTCVCALPALVVQVSLDRDKILMSRFKVLYNFILIKV